MGKALLLLLGVLLCSLGHVRGIFESQLGQYDWLNQGIGYTKDMVALAGGNLIVSSEDGVLASLAVRDGSVKWRHALPQGGIVEALAADEELAMVYAVVTTPCARGKADCSLTMVRGWGLKQGTMVFDTLLGSSEATSPIDVAFYHGIGLSVLAHNTVFDVDAMTGLVRTKWSPDDKHAVLSALPHRKIERAGGGIRAVGCYTSGSGACGKTVLVTGDDSPSISYASSVSAASPEFVKPAFGATEDSIYVYAVDAKGTSVSILKVQTGKVTTVSLPNKIAGDASAVDVSRIASHITLEDVVVKKADTEGDDEEEGGDLSLMPRASLLVLRCTLHGNCATSSVSLPTPGRPEISTPVLSDTSLTCSSGGGSGEYAGRSIIGAGRAPHSGHEGAGEDSMFCVTATFDEEKAEYGVAVSSLDSDNERHNRYDLVVPSNKRHGFKDWTYASCSLVPNRSGKRVTKAEATAAIAKQSGGDGGKGSPSPLLCVAVSTTGTTMAFKREVAIGSSSSGRSHAGGVSLVWTREEALSRVESAALYTRPEHEEEVQADRGPAISVQELVSAGINSLLKARTTVHTAIRSLVSSIMNPVSSAHGAGSALHSSVKREAKALAASQAKLYGFDKIAVLITTGASSSGEKVVIGLDVLEENVLWALELPASASATRGSGGGETEGEMDKTVRIDTSTVAIISSRWDSTRAMMVDIETGAVKDMGNLVLPGFSVKGIFCTDTKIANTMGAKSADGAGGANKYALLLESNAGSDRRGGLKAVQYPYHLGTNDQSQIDGMFLSQITQGEAVAFESLRVLPNSACTSAVGGVGVCTTASGAGSGAPLHDVEVLARTVFDKGERVSAVAYQQPDDAINSRATTLGDDSVLMKYLNPSTALVVTEGMDGEKSGSDSTLSRRSSNSSISTRLEVHLLDTVSSKLLYRSTIPNGASPVSAVLIENNVIVVYWNSLTKRTEVSSVALFEGMIDKNGMTPWAAKSSASIAAKHIANTRFSSFTAPLPMTVQKTYVLPKTVTTATSTITQQGVAKKALVVGTAGGQVFGIDRMLIDPRRPMENPTMAEKKDGLLKYEPFIAFTNVDCATHNYSLVEGPHTVVSASSRLESSSIILSASRLDVHFNRVIPSMAFDLLSNDFNYPLLTIILSALFALVVWMQRALTAKKKARAWQ